MGESDGVRALLGPGQGLCGRSPGNDCLGIAAGKRRMEWNERKDAVGPILELVRVYEQLRPPSLQVVPGKVTQRAEDGSDG